MAAKQGVALPSRNGDSLSAACGSPESPRPSFMQKKTKPTRKQHEDLVLWAALCAEHVLPYFEKECPKDDRPRKAIEEARKWVRERKPMKMAVIRKASLDAHAAARATENPAARAAARAAGQAVATVHVATHAPGAAYYGLKAVGAAGKAGESKWQQNHLPKHLRLLS